MSTPCILGLEPLMVARLVAEVTLPGVRVLSIADVAEAKEASLPKPSVRVVYYGYQVLPEKDGAPRPPGWALIEETWLAVPAVRNVATLREGAPSRAEAVPLVDATLEALDGWNPGEGYSPLKCITPPLRPATIDGCTYVPLAFTTRFRRKKSCPT